MNKLLLSFIILFFSAFAANGQNTPTGNPKDFKVKTCLHSVSYMGVWRGQATLSVDEFLVKAKELGFDGVMLAAKRPHVSLIDYDDAARQKLRARLKELGLELVCIAGYTDFTAGVDKAVQIDNGCCIKVAFCLAGETPRPLRGISLVGEKNSGIYLNYTKIMRIFPPLGGIKRGFVSTFVILG